MHDAEADFDVNRIVLVIIFHALSMCTLICIKGLEDDDNDIDDVFHVDYSDRFISVCGYIFAKGNGWRCSSLDQERRRGKKVVRIQKLFRSQRSHDKDCSINKVLESCEAADVKGFFGSWMQVR